MPGLHPFHRSAAAGSDDTKLPAGMAPFPLLDWLMVGNHLFTIGSLGYFMMNWVSLTPSYNLINSRTSEALMNAGFFGIGLFFVLSSISYWIDILLFPRHWTRRRCYHPLIRTEHQEIDKIAQITATTSAESSPVPTIPLGSYHIKQIKVLTLNSDIIEPSIVSSIVTSPSISNIARTPIVRNLPENELSPGLLGRIAPNFFPIRLESWCELANLAGSVLNTLVTMLPYCLASFHAQHGIGYNSVPLSIAIMDFFAMTVWLVSAFLVYYVWRRDRIQATREELYELEYEKEGLDELSNEENRLEKDQELRLKIRKEFNPKTIRNLNVDFRNLQWIAAITNILGSFIYWAAAAYGISISINAAKGKLESKLRHENGDGTSSGNLHLSPQEIREMVNEQRFFNLIGDCIFVVCALCCELVYYNEVRRDMQQAREAGKKSQPASIEVSPIMESSQPFLEPSPYLRPRSSSYAEEDGDEEDGRLLHHDDRRISHIEISTSTALGDQSAHDHNTERSLRAHLLALDSPPTSSSTATTLDDIPTYQPRRKESRTRVRRSSEEEEEVGHNDRRNELNPFYEANYIPPQVRMEVSVADDEAKQNDQDEADEDAPLF